MKQKDISWIEALQGHLEAKHHTQLSKWLVEHLQILFSDVIPECWLLSIAEDTCDAGHVHHDMALWVVDQFELSTIMITEEHYDLGPLDVETTFDMSIAHHPLDCISGSQLMTVNQPDGKVLEIGMAVMIRNPGMTGHSEPIPTGESDLTMIGVTMAPATISIMGYPERLREFKEFRNALLTNRRAFMGFGQPKQAGYTRSDSVDVSFPLDTSRPKPRIQRSENE